jgi:hypothetical protein
VLAFGTHGCPAIFKFLLFCSLSWHLARAGVDIIVGNGFFKAQNTSAGSSSDASCVCRAMELWSRRLGSRRPPCNLPSCREPVNSWDGLSLNLEMQSQYSCSLASLSESYQDLMCSRPVSSEHKRKEDREMCTHSFCISISPRN